MRQIDLENDIKSLSEFRANAAKFVKQVKEKLTAFKQIRDS